MVADVKFTDEDVVNLDEWIPRGDYNPHNVRPWLIHDHGYVVCVVFAASLQDAIDEAVDADKLDRYLVSEEDLKDYEGSPEQGWEGISHLGNAGEPFDIESLGYVELPNPPLSFKTCYEAHVESIADQR